MERGRTTLRRESGPSSLRKEDEVEVFIALLGLSLFVGFVLIIVASKGSKTRQLDENRRAARRYDNGV
jgi:hypothetical protein